MYTAVIINPNARGVTKKILLIIKRYFANNGSVIFIPRTAKEATRIAAKVAARHGSRIIVVGGDGTINAVVNGIARSSAQLGIIPAGTANDLALAVGISGNIRQALDIIQQGKTRAIDLIKVGRWHYATGGGIGLPARVALFANLVRKTFPLSKKTGSLIYLLGVLYHLLKGSYRPDLVEISKNGRYEKKEVLFLTISNQPKIGKRFCTTPGARNDDRVYDICLTENPKNWIRRIWIILKTIRGRHTGEKWVSQWRGNTLRLVSDKPVTFMADGELRPPAQKFLIKLVPSALQLIVPEEKN